MGCPELQALPLPLAAASAGVTHGGLSLEGCLATSCTATFFALSALFLPFCSSPEALKAPGISIKHMRKALFPPISLDFMIRFWEFGEGVDSARGVAVIVASCRNSSCNSSYDAIDRSGRKTIAFFLLCRLQRFVCNTSHEGGSKHVSSVGCRGKYCNPTSCRFHPLGGGGGLTQGRFVILRFPLFCSVWGSLYASRQSTGKMTNRPHFAHIHLNPSPNTRRFA